MQEEVRIIKFENLIKSLKNGDKFTLIDVVNRDQTDERLRSILLNVLETGDIRNLDYEFDGGNINLAYKSAEELVYSLELKREYPVIILYKATGSVDPIIVYREGQELSCDLENKKIIFKNNGENIVFDILKNKVDIALKVSTEISKYKLSPDPGVILEILNEIL